MRARAALAFTLVAASSLASGCSTGEPLPAGVEVALRGHFEGVPTPDGGVIPVFDLDQPKLSVCLGTPPEIDTSRWVARLGLGGRGAHSVSEAEWTEPSVRQEATLCFFRELSTEPDSPDSKAAANAQSAPAPANETELCFELRDAYDDRSFQRVCRPCHFRTKKTEIAALIEARQKLLASGWAERGFLPWLDELEALAARSDQAQAPFFATQLRLIGVDLARRQGDARVFERGRRLLAALPRWLEHSEASDLGGQAAYVAAEFALAEGRPLAESWAALREADRRYLRIASDLRFTVAMRQGAILGEMGAAREGAARIRRALAERTPPKEGAIEDLVAAAEGELAWLLLLDPQAPPEDFAEAAELIERASRRKAQLKDPVEDANLALNRAYLALRAHQLPTVETELRSARSALAAASPSARRDTLAAWADLLGGLAAEARSDSTAALALCRAPANQIELPRLAAWGASCLGAAHRRRGQLDDAARELGRALALHERATSAEWGQEVPIGPGQRADDFYRAARVEIERNQPAQAWEILDRLDALAANEEDERGCAARLAPPARAELERARRERERLAAELEALSVPSSVARRRQLESTRRALSERLQEISRRELPCATTPRPSTADLRAIALEDEILLLARDPNGTITTLRRTAIPRRDVAHIVRAVEQALDARTLDDDAWRKLTEPLAAALAPAALAGIAGIAGGSESTESSDSRQASAPTALRPERPLVYALHGSLQGVPLAALPVEARKGGVGNLEGRWFSDFFLPAYQPAAPAPSEATESPKPRGLFVVDPQKNLAAGAASARFYRKTFPQADVLEGKDATRTTVEAGLGAAIWLHVDAHGNYDPAFPELSSLGLADGALPFSRLAELPMPRALVNLSGCRTGGWPITADSGRYGLAGLCARRGARWAIGSRADLDDRFAAEFNQTFYQSWRQGANVPESFSAALASTRSKHKAAAWGGLMLIAGAEGGQNDRQPTPVRE